MFIDIHKYPYLAYDTETTGLLYPVDKAFGVAIATPDGNSYYWDLREYPGLIEILNHEFRKYTGKIICHNASFDYKMSLSAGIEIPVELLDDTVIRACCINEHEREYGLDYLGKKYCGIQKETEIYEEMAAMFGGIATRNVQMQNIYKAPSKVVAPYAMRDVEVTLALYEWQEKEIERQGIEKIIRFEKSKMPLFIETEVRGLRVDIPEAERAVERLSPIIQDTQLFLNRSVGTSVNVNSPAQVKKIFSPKQKADGTWQTDSGFPLPSTPKGNASLGKEVLMSMGDERAKTILELRSLIKTRDTFLMGHVLGHEHNGRVYPNINQSKGEDGGTQTGRLSYSEPAMQQIPSRNKKVAEIVKKCFLPEEGQLWMDVDMASFEVRMFAHLVAKHNDTVARYHIENPLTDLHKYVSELMNIPRNPTPKSMIAAKTLNLGMIFCMGPGTVADNLGLPWTWESFIPKGENRAVTYKKPGPEAEKLLDTYHAHVPGIRELADECRHLAKVNGYLETLSGRRLRFPTGNVYKASAVFVQSNSADINKENWTLVDEALGDKGTLLLNTHDSYSCSVDEDWKPIWKRVKKSLEENRGLRVPLIADLNGVGINWWEALQGA